MVKLSVIVPVHNGEKSLERCLTSITNQIMQDLEVVVIDAGSTDGSRQIAQRFTNDHHNFKVVHQDSANLGKAKNLGLEMISGDMVTFVSQTDTLDPPFALILTTIIQGNNCDIASTSDVNHDNDGGMWTLLDSEDHFYDGIYTPEQWMEVGYRYLWTIFSSAWGKIYKTKLFDHVHFPERAMEPGLEDEDTIWKVYLEAKRIAFASDFNYHHWISDDHYSNYELLKSIQDRIPAMMMLGMDVQYLITDFKKILKKIDTDGTTDFNGQLTAKYYLNLLESNGQGENEDE